jgi:hypothetical protein
MPSERKLNVSLSMKIKGASTSVKVLPWDPFATFNVAVLIHSFIHIGCAFGTTICEANMVDTCKHFELGSGSVRSLSYLSVFVIEHLCRAEGATNTKQIK